MSLGPAYPSKWKPIAILGSVGGCRRHRLLPIPYHVVLACLSAAFVAVSMAADGEQGVVAVDRVGWW
jgi:hypothetical protein